MATLVCEILKWHQQPVGLEFSEKWLSAASLLKRTVRGNSFVDRRRLLIVHETSLTRHEVHGVPRMAPGASIAVA
jgi:hypothetical protein